MNEEMISVIEVAAQLGRRKPTIFKVAKRLGIHPHKRRDAGSGNQVVSYLTHADYLRVKDALPPIDEKVSGENDNGDGFISAEIGVFYLIQLEPKHDPLRFKVGFAANVNDRLRALKCSAPFSTVVSTWPCRRLWEKTAIDCVTFECDRLHTEVFRGHSIESITAKCEQFFAMMPPAQ